jgi:hypothetical protein
LQIEGASAVKNPAHPAYSRVRDTIIAGRQQAVVDLWLADNGDTVEQKCDQSFRRCTSLRKKLINGEVIYSGVACGFPFMVDE